MKARLVVACAWLVVAGGCGGGGGNGTDGGPLTIRVSGTVPRGAARVRVGALGPATDLPGVGDGSQIDRVVALGHYRGMVGSEGMDNAVIADLPADGSFDLELPVGPDYVLLLEDSTAPRWERVRAYVTVADLQDALMTLPLSRAAGNLALGTLREGEGGSAVAQTTLGEAASTFGLDRATLVEMARVDDSFRSLINTWQNYDRDSKVYYSLNSTLMFADRYERLLTDTTSPEGYTFVGYIVYGASNDPRLDVDAICANTQSIRLIPPADVRTIDGLAYGPERPLQGGKFETFDGHCYSPDFGGLGPDPIRGVTWSTQTFGEMVEGLWTLEIDSVPVAKFDLSLASPVDADGRARGAIPRVRPTIAADGQLEALDVEWLRWSADDAAWVDANQGALRELFRGSSLGLSSMGGGTSPVMADEGFPTPSRDDVLFTHGVPVEQAWYAGPRLAAPSGVPVIGELNAYWEIGGLSYRMTWWRDCVDVDGDGQTDCMGDPDDVLSDQSECRVANAARPPADEGGTLWHSLEANYWGSFNLAMSCVWAPGPRPYSRVTYSLERLDGTVVAAKEEEALWGFFAAVDHGGAGDYRVVVTGYDAMGDAHESVTTYFHALSFDELHPPPAIEAKLSAASLEVVFNYFVATTQSDPVLLCGELFGAATLELFGAAGCDTALFSATDCGACGVPCGGSETCQAGVCYDAGGACTYPAADCDANAGTGPGGCEVDLLTDAANCGACGRACAAGAACLAGFCRERCALVTGDCDANAGTGPDGCETDLLHSTAHCGACGRACAGGETCTDGLCQSASSGCAPGTADCDANPATGPGGCEADLYAENANCGGCGLACPAGARCRGGACHERCPAGSGDCDGAGSAPYLGFTCLYVGDGRHFLVEWGANPPPVKLGDRITLGTTAPWSCEGLSMDANSYLLPCPEVFPPLSTRVVAAP